MVASRPCSDTRYPHPKCASCQSVITRRSRHAHLYNLRDSIDDTICGDCFDVTALAAIPVMRTAEAIGVPCSYKALAWALKEELIAVIGQVSMPGV